MVNYPGKSCSKYKVYRVDDPHVHRRCWVQVFFGVVKSRITGEDSFMDYLVIITGIALILLGALLVAMPRIFFDFFRKHENSLKLQVVTVILNLVFGLLFMTYAQGSRFPTVFTVIGLLTVLKAVIPMLIGRTDFKDLMSWYMKVLPPFGRVIGVAEAMFGSFLIYAAI